MTTTHPMWKMWTLRDRMLAEAIAAKRNLGLSPLDPQGWTVVDGPDDGDYTVMTRRESAEITACDGCYDGTPHGHECDDSCDSCGHLRGVPAPDGCSCATGYTSRGDAHLMAVTAPGVR